jgi:hypothetical protein
MCVNDPNVYFWPKKELPGALFPGRSGEISRYYSRPLPDRHAALLTALNVIVYVLCEMAFC